MRHPRTRTIGTLLVLLLATTTLSAGELWDRAVDTYHSFQDLQPGRITIRFDQYNGRGKLVSSETSQYELEVGPTGEIEGRVTFASKDGEDITEKRQEESGDNTPFGGDDQQEESDSPFSGLQASPFDPDEQARVAVTDTGQTELVDGIRTRVHRFEHSTGGENRTTGTAWIAEENGAPVRVSAGIQPLPGFIDEFQMDQSFTVDSEGRWYMTRMEFVGEGNILFVRRRIESEFEFSDYFLPPQGPLN